MRPTIQRLRKELIKSCAGGLMVAMSVLACGPAATTQPGNQSTEPTVTQPRTTDARSPQPVSTAATFDPKSVRVSFLPVATVAGGPLAFGAPTDGSGRMFIAAQDGRVWVTRLDAAGPELALDLRSLVSTGGERGLLGFAVHPHFPDDPRIFVDYTDRAGNTVVASYRVGPDDPGRVDPGTAMSILAVDQPYANHNGGALAFGPDGMLYVSLGDGGGGGDPQGNGQRLDTLLGKILRLEVDGVGASPYAIPADNPFMGTDGARPEIWLSGLRNPWRMAFDRASGDLWIGDVGQEAWEEVDVAPAGVGGLNFGWHVMEGRHCYAPASGCAGAGLTPPRTEYGHDLGCTVIGGSAYRGTAQPLLAGGYLFADFCSGRIWGIPSDRTSFSEPVQVGETGPSTAAFGEGADGELYAANLDGTIWRVVAARR